MTINGTELDVKPLSPGEGEAETVRQYIKTASEEELIQAILRSGRDPRTGLLNSRGLEEEATRVKNNLKANEAHLAGIAEDERNKGNRLIGVAGAQVSCFDLSGFKAYNDAYGQTAGNEVLNKFAQKLVEVYKRDTDIHARLGGDEFAVLSINSDISDKQAKIMQEELDQSLPQGVKTYMVFKSFYGDVDALKTVDSVMNEIEKAKVLGPKDATGRSIGGAFVSLNRINSNV